MKIRIKRANTELAIIENGWWYILPRNIFCMAMEYCDELQQAAIWGRECN